MNRREIKEDCYHDMLKDSIVAVESIINQLHKLADRKGMFADYILQKATYRTYFDLELALANVCILLRKMAENVFITLPTDIRRDINSIIHSNKFEYEENRLYVYSQRGKEEVSIDQLLTYAKSILPQ